MPTSRIELAPGLAVPALGLGTWKMGEDSEQRRVEVNAIRTGLDYGLCLIDTAEMYGEGEAEQVVGEAIRGRRDEVTLVSKFYPHNASRLGVIAACEASLRRLGTDRLDVYLLHWRGEIPLAETVAALERLKDAGKIRHYGVSNFDSSDLADWEAAGGRGVTNQILYNLGRRNPELAVLPDCHRLGLSVMAYSPIEQGRLLGHPVLAAEARRLEASPAAVALAWLLRQRGVIAIPKASDPAHIAENCRALRLVLDEEALAALERAFPRPTHPVPLEMI